MQAAALFLALCGQSHVKLAFAQTPNVAESIEPTDAQKVVTEPGRRAWKPRKPLLPGKPRQ